MAVVTEEATVVVTEEATVVVTEAAAAFGVHVGGHIAGGGRGRFWHGHWYGYGVGSCWRSTPAGYIWICG